MQAAGQTPSRGMKQAFAGPHPKEPCAHSEGSGIGSVVRRQQAADDPATPVAADNKESGCTDDGRGGRLY